MIPKAKGYFSGMGLMEIGMMQGGVEFIQSLDLDKDAIESMHLNSHYFNHSILHKDIKDMQVLQQEKSDIIVGTYPCTKYSPIADIHGTRTGDELFLHMFRHIAIEQPEMYVIENVPGMKKFPVVMEAMSKLPQYYVNIFCQVSATMWLPQKRDRLILIGTRKPFTVRHPEMSAKRVQMKDIVEDNPEIEMPEYVHARIRGEYRDKPIVVDPEDINSLAPTCVAHYAKDLGTRMVKDRNSKYGIRPFTVREYARLQGVPEDIKFKGTRSDYKLIGNGVPVPMGKWIGEECMRYFN